MRTGIRGGRVGIGTAPVDGYDMCLCCDRRRHLAGLTGVVTPLVANIQGATVANADSNVEYPGCSLSFVRNSNPAPPRTGFLPPQQCRTAASVDAPTGPRTISIAVCRKFPHSMCTAPITCRA